MSPNESRTRLTEYLVHFLWRQWEQLGVASTDEVRRDGWAIDPEALWLLSGTVARHDARLFDEIMDWLATNASFVNAPRLRSLARKFGFQSTPVVAAMADVVMRTNSRLRWDFSLFMNERPAEPLFLNTDGTPQPDFGDPDPAFLRFGLKRGRVELRGLSRRFNAVMPECSLLRLRALFGPSARAEIILYLLTHNMAHPSLIARETGFSQKNIQDTLVDMCASGLVHSAQLEGRKKAYFMKKDQGSAFLHQRIRPRWITWPPICRGLEVLADGLARIESSDASALLRASEVRRVISEVRPYFELAGCVGLLTSPQSSTEEEILTTLFNDLRDLLG